MKERSFEFSIWVDGRPVPEYLDEARGTMWLKAGIGQEFELYVGNGTNKRVLAVPSVDGLSVLDGKPRSGNSGGYIVRPRSHVLIPGWRLDNDSVARFEFGDLKAGYVVLMGQPQENIGVITCAFFIEAWAVAEIAPPEPERSQSCGPGGNYNSDNQEQTSLEPSLDYPRIEKLRDLTSSILGRLRPAPSQTGRKQAPPRSESSHVIAKPPTKPGVDTTRDDIAVKFGRKSEHKVVMRSFKRASKKPEVLLTLRYDTIKGLKARGIGCEPPKMWKRWLRR